MVNVESDVSMLVVLQLLFLFINEGMKWNISFIILFSPLILLIGVLILAICIWRVG